MSYPKPAIRVTLNGVDLTAKIAPRLLQMTLTEARAGEVDQLDLSIHDHDGRLEIPRRGAEINVMIGWSDTGLVDKGLFTVDEIEHEGAPDIVTLRARSAEMTSEKRVRNERSWHKKTIGEIVGAIAAEHGLRPRVGAFGSELIDHVDQTNESDIHFLNRLGQRFDAVATIKNGALLFLPIGAARTSTGAAMGSVTLSRKTGDKHRYHLTGRDAYSGAKAEWHDPQSAERKSAVAGSDQNAKKMRDTYANEGDAQRAATSEWQRLQRGKVTLNYSLALGRADISPEMSAHFPDMKAPISEIEWLVIKSTHSMSNAGFTTQLEMEMKGDDAIEKDRDENAG